MDPQTAAVLAQFPPSPLVQKLGIEITEVTAERCVATMPVEGNTQVMGLLHGGASAALAETVGSYGAMAHAYPDGIAVGVDLNITHHKAMREGVVTATATAVHLGRLTATHVIEILSEDGKRVATGRITNLIRPAN